MKLIKTLKNIWKIEELKSRLLTTLLLVVVFRFGSFVVPGYRSSVLTSLHAQTREGLMSLLNMFTGGAFSNASVFGLVSCLHFRIHCDKLQYSCSISRSCNAKEKRSPQNESIHRYLTVAILASRSLLVNLSANGCPSFRTVPYVVVILLASGSMFTLWLGEHTDRYW